MKHSSDILLDGLTFPECPRWHGGALWFSDVHAHAIMRMTADGKAQRMIEDARQPAGLGWLPNGDLLYARMVDRKLVHAGAAPTAEHAVVANLADHERVQINDMVVSAEGRAYIGGFGFDINTGEQFAASTIMLVDVGDAATPSTAAHAADGMRFPNGMVITPDGKTLIAAETAGRCLTAFDVAADGTLANRREWAALTVFPDGICLDAENAVWVASPTSGECIRVRVGGEVNDTVKSHAKGVYACMLGGDDGRTLYLCTANTTGPELAQGISTGWIEAVQGDVPHAGLP